MTVAVDGPARAPGPRERQPVHRGDLRRRRRTTRTTAARSRSCGRPARGTITVTVSAKGCDDRTRHGRSREPVTWELRWHPFRAEWVLFTAHRGARPWIGETVPDDEPEVPDDNALAPLGRRIATTNPDYRGVFVFTNDLPVFSPDAPEPTHRRRPVPHPTRGGNRRGGLLPPRPHEVDGRPRRRRGRRRRAHLEGPDRSAASARRRGPRADLREPRRRGRHVESPSALPDLRRCPRVRHDGTRSRGRGRAPPPDRARAPGRRRRAGAGRTAGDRRATSTSSPACRGSRATPTRCTCCPADR